MKGLLFFLFLGISLADHSSILPPSTASPSKSKLPEVDACKCETVTYGADELKGYLKVNHTLRLSCDKEAIQCEFKIEPKDGYSISLTLFHSPPPPHISAYINIFYYKDSTDKKDLIYFDDVSSYGGEIISPKEFGIYIKASVFTANYEDNIDALFIRIKNTGTKRCPSPYITATPTPQSLDLTNFPKTGCAFRITADHPISILPICDSNSRTRLRVNYAGSMNSVENRIVGWDKERVNIKLITDDADLLLRPESDYFYYSYMCKISYFSLNYDPCNCTQTDFKLNVNQPRIITSPGYPSLLCNNIRCFYSFTVVDKPELNFHTAFMVDALHQSRALGDTLSIFADEKSVAKLNDHYKNMTDMAIYNAEKLEVRYMATTTFSLNHGFTMKVTAFHTPSDCLCSTDTIKPLTGNSYNMTIPAHCPLMNCRFSIFNEQPNQNRMFRLKVAYHLPHEGEILELEGGQVQHRHIFEENDLDNDAIGQEMVDLVTNTSVSLQYLREKAVNSSVTDSNFTLSWEWLTSNDCECVNPTLLATKGWTSLYSPRHPQEYCSNMDCHYSVVAPEGYLVQLNVSMLDTEPHRDFLTIIDGEEGKELAKLAGKTLPAGLIQTTVKEASLRFTSDENYVGKGFNLLYRSIRDPSLPKVTTPGHIPLMIFVILIVVCVLGGVVYLAYKKSSYFREFLKRVGIGQNSTAPSCIINPVFSFSAADETLIDKTTVATTDE